MLLIYCDLYTPYSRMQHDIRKALRSVITLHIIIKQSPAVLQTRQSKTAEQKSRHSFYVRRVYMINKGVDLKQN